MNKIINDWPGSIHTARVISSAACSGRPDRVHFSPAGYRELGKRYAETMLLLSGYKMAHPI